MWYSNFKNHEIEMTKSYTYRKHQTGPDDYVLFDWFVFLLHVMM